MDSKDQLDLIKGQLDRVLGFFSRVDGKISVVLGVDLTMLAVLVAASPPLKFYQWYMALFALASVVFLIVSLWQLYLASFPQMEGGNQSLIYFREIATRTESQYVEEFLAKDIEELKKDLLCQIWRNSEILKQKFDHLKTSFNFFAISVPFWLIALAIFALKNTELKGLLSR